MVLPSALLIPEPWEARLADADEKCGKQLGDEETAAMVVAVVIVISTPYLSPLSKGLQGPSPQLSFLSLSVPPQGLTLAPHMHQYIILPLQLTPAWHGNT